MEISHTSNCKLKITSLEIKKLNLFNKGINECVGTILCNYIPLQ